MQGNIYPLANALSGEDKKKVQKEISQQFPGSSTQDIIAALDYADAPSIKRIGLQVTRTQFQQQKNECVKLATGFANIHLGPEEEQEINLSEECLWVPASVRHEVKKDSNTGLNRHSFFVYGGVNVQPRVNVIQGGNRPLGGNPIGGGSFNRTQATKGYQEHHIVSNTNRYTKNHEAFVLAGMSMNARANKIYLPNNSALHPTRSIHRGRHTNSYSATIAKKLDEVVNKGTAQGWTKEQYRAAIRTELSKLRQELRAGNIGLNKNHRNWATKW